MEEKMNVESTVVEVVETKENFFTKGLNKVKNVTLGDVAKGAALLGLGALAAFGISKVVSGGDTDIVEDAIEIIELDNE